LPNFPGYLTSDATKFRIFEGSVVLPIFKVISKFLSLVIFFIDASIKYCS